MDGRWLDGLTVVMFWTLVPAWASSQHGCQGVCLLMWWLASARKKVELPSLLEFGRELAQHHFGHILLVTTSHKASLDLRGHYL